jgi:hypothetical protein
VASNLFLELRQVYGIFEREEHLDYPFSFWQLEATAHDGNIYPSQVSGCLARAFAALHS